MAIAIPRSPETEFPGPERKPLPGGLDHAIDTTQDMSVESSHELLTHTR